MLGAMSVKSVISELSAMASIFIMSMMSIMSLMYSKNFIYDNSINSNSTPQNKIHAVDKSVEPGPAVERFVFGKFCIGDVL
jgi:hypothetical protein